MVGAAMTHPDGYPRDYGPGTHWATDAAWQIMDLLEPAAISTTVRDLMAGMIAGALLAAHQRGASERDHANATTVPT